MFKIIDNHLKKLKIAVYSSSGVVQVSRSCKHLDYGKQAVLSTFIFSVVFSRFQISPLPLKLFMRVIHFHFWVYLSLHIFQSHLSGVDLNWTLWLVTCSFDSALFIIAQTYSEVGMWDFVIKCSWYIITRLLPIIPKRDSKAPSTLPSPAPQCFLAKNSHLHNFRESCYKTTPGFLLNEVEVKGDRDTANSSASCLNRNASTPQRGVGSRGNEHLWEAHTLL